MFDFLRSSQSTTMLTYAVLLIAVSHALAGPAFMKYFKIEEPAKKPDLNMVEYPEDLKVALPDTPMKSGVYKLSYADYHVTWEEFKTTHSK